MTVRSFGVMSHIVSDDASPAGSYRRAIDHARRAESLGFDGFWVAQHHVSPAYGDVPSPLVFLAHLGALCRRLQFGVAVIALPVEHPVRVAEDITTLQALIGDRLDVGIGPGNAGLPFEELGIDAGDLPRLFSERAAVLVSMLAGGEIAAGSGIPVHPAALPGIQQRIHQATHSAERSPAIAAAGLGLITSVSHRLSFDGLGTRTAFDEQSTIVDGYLAALPVGVPPRITATRAVLVTDDVDLTARLRAVALERLADAFFQISPGEALDRLGTRDVTHGAEVFGAVIGPPGYVLDQLEGDRAAARADRILFQSQPITNDPHLVLASDERLASHVLPRLRHRAPVAAQSK